MKNNILINVRMDLIVSYTFFIYKKATVAKTTKSKSPNFGTSLDTFYQLKVKGS